MFCVKIDIIWSNFDKKRKMTAIVRQKFVLIRLTDVSRRCEVFSMVLLIKHGLEQLET